MNFYYNGDIWFRVNAFRYELCKEKYFILNDIPNTFKGNEGLFEVITWLLDEIK